MSPIIFSVYWDYSLNLLQGIRCSWGDVGDAGWGWKIFDTIQSSNINPSRYRCYKTLKHFSSNNWLLLNKLSWVITANDAYYIQTWRSPFSHYTVLYVDTCRWVGVWWGEWRGYKLIMTVSCTTRPLSIINYSYFSHGFCGVHVYARSDPPNIWLIFALFVIKNAREWQFLTHGALTQLNYNLQTYRVRYTFFL